MSTTTDGAGLVRVNAQPLRRLNIIEGPFHLATAAISSLLPGQAVVWDFIMGDKLPDDIKPQAKNRFKFRLQICLCGKIASFATEFRLICLLNDRDTIKSKDNPYLVVSYMYVGMMSCSTGKGYFDEYRSDDVIENPVIQSLFQDRHQIFRTLIQRR